MATATAPRKTASKSARPATRHTASGSGMGNTRITAENGRIFLRVGGAMTWDLSAQEAHNLAQTLTEYAAKLKGAK